MLRPSPGASRRLAAALASRRGAAAVEFAFVAPVLLTCLFGVYDFSRALMARQELTNAAEAVANVAANLSVQTSTVSTSLTAAQMQAAMSVVYAQMPGLALGSGGGGFAGTFSVSLSEVVFYPTCAAAKPIAANGCSVQAPYVYWSTYLDEGGAKLLQSAALLRPCSAQLRSQVNFPNNANQPNVMIPVASNATTTLAPQLVADVVYNFVPVFPLFPAVTLRASATLPSPMGVANDQIVSWNGSGTPPAPLVTCPWPPSS